MDKIKEYNKSVDILLRTAIQHSRGIIPINKLVEAARDYTAKYDKVIASRFSDC